MGSLVRCTGCGRRCGTRPVGVYWRWMRADGAWKKYYTRLCVGCYAAKVEALQHDYADDEQLTCPQCGIGTELDYDAIYTTAFPGKGDQVDADAPFCGVHAAEYRVWVVDHARDTDAVDGAPEPRPPTTSTQAVYQGLGRPDPRRFRG